jgi:uncharacterized protein (DUF4213/DUF364 family)
MLLDNVCDQLLPVAAARSVTDVRVGLGYTAVQLDDGRAALRILSVMLPAVGAAR